MPLSAGELLIAGLLAPRCRRQAYVMMLPIFRRMRLYDAELFFTQYRLATFAGMTR